ncbi:nucleotidyltransferase substrate binding protein, HI0074 family [Thermosinus carboxydivorans Nor1]|uniref:Nucleotidyltransferase substrate binding protein, HI0074 family n=1 Tax=Thermosinus carboxydivorans Nor1 TaxID=401526 RepID=A1HM71_9FIRM|nr:nucleotidyltransferase substrate binding protein [Thermosinus carboxydivorans]EAX48919.1 nucleotidyltransferase substrate binding protein, HI0074 family [Thermosinus carboxydivorans Nor1]
MNIERLSERAKEYQKAVRRLQEALAEDLSNILVYDGVIQRFEFTYELAWKLIKAYLEYEGIADVKSPRAAFKEAFTAGLIDNGEIWLEMIDDRNLTAHTYNEENAKQIYAKVKEKYFPQFATLANKIAEAVK